MKVVGPPTIRVSHEGSVATVTLARAERRNALLRVTLTELTAACRELSERQDVRVVVFQGEGRDFSVGIDLQDPELALLSQADIGERRRALRAGPEMVRAVQSLPQTTIAALHGFCLGGGACLALACDLRVVAEDFRFGMPEVLRGMNMSWGIVPLLMATVGVTRAKELLLTGAHIRVAEAIDWGLANRRVSGSAEEVSAAALAWATELAQSVPPLAAAMIKETMNAVANAHTPMVHMDLDQHLMTQHTADFAESISAFMAKRPPKFEGR